MLATGLIVAYGYAMEAFFALVYSGNHYEKFMMQNRMLGLRLGLLAVDSDATSLFRSCSGSIRSART